MVKDVGGSEASITPADQTSGTYKAVLILGQGMAVEDSVLDRFRQEGYLLIGDGKKPVSPKDCEVLKNKIDSNTKICIYAQGSLDTVKGHSIEGSATAEFLRVIKRQSKNEQPLNIHLISSFAGKAANDVDLLPPGSMLVVHGTADAALSNDVVLKTLKDFTQAMSTPSATNPWQDYVDNFATYVKQTTIIAIGEFRYTMRPLEGVLTDPEQIRAYLESERQIFVTKYNEEFDPPLTISREIDLTQATTWINAQRLSVASQTPSRNTDQPAVTAAPAPPELPKVTAPPPLPPHPPISKPSLPTTTSQEALYQNLKYKNQTTFVEMTAIEEIPNKKLFVSKDNYAFDIEDLVAYFKTTGGIWLNPYTNKPFVEEDRNRLIANYPELAALAQEQLQGTEKLSVISEETFEKIAKAAEITAMSYEDQHFLDPSYVKELGKIAQELGFIANDVDLEQITSMDTLFHKYLFSDTELYQSIKTAYKTRVVFNLHEYLMTKQDELDIIDGATALNSQFNYFGVKNFSDLFVKIKLGDKNCLNGASGTLVKVLETIQHLKASSAKQELPPPTSSIQTAVPQIPQQAVEQLTTTPEQPSQESSDPLVANAPNLPITAAPSLPPRPVSSPPTSVTQPKSQERPPIPISNPAKIMQQYKKQKSEQILAIEPQTDLARTVRSVVSSYSTFAKSKMGSRHGETGRKRAESFYASIARETDENKVNEAIKTYLKDETNGNTHPHSFRTMLLSKLTHTDRALMPETLKSTSVNYNTMRENYSNPLPPSTLTG